MTTTEPRRHILVINDSPDILNLFADLLTDEGYRVTTDTFMAEMSILYEHVRTIQPDLIILDMIIGREALGWQLAQLLKMSPQTSRIPLILCTGAVKQVEELATHLNNMAIGVVIKPFEIDRLLEVIDRTWEKVADPASLALMPDTGNHQTGIAGTLEPEPARETHPFQPPPTMPPQTPDAPKPAGSN